ncbi:hypothetical protein ANCCAN_28873, partial [Ancylostoma caninum]
MVKPSIMLIHTPKTLLQNKANRDKSFIAGQF